MKPAASDVDAKPTFGVGRIAARRLTEEAKRAEVSGAMLEHIDG